MGEEEEAEEGWQKQGRPVEQGKVQKGRREIGRRVQAIERAYCHNTNPNI